MDCLCMLCNIIQVLCAFVSNFINYLLDSKNTEIQQLALSSTSLHFESSNGISFYELCNNFFITSY